MSYRNTNKFKSFFLKIFTVGNRFSVRDFYDRLKKYAVEGIGIFIVISFSFYVENKAFHDLIAAKKFIENEQVKNIKENLK